MDRGAGQATVHGATESDKPKHSTCNYLQFALCSLIGFIALLSPFLFPFLSSFVI